MIVKVTRRTSSPRSRISIRSGYEFLGIYCKLGAFGYTYVNIYEHSASGGDGCARLTSSRFNNITNQNRRRRRAFVHNNVSTAGRLLITIGRCNYSERNLWTVVGGGGGGGGARVL